MDDLFRALPELLRAAGETEAVAEAAACVAWRRIAGAQLRGQAVPFRLYRKTLTVAVADATWQKQLEQISGQLLFRLNSVLGQPLVTYIEFRVYPQTVRIERARLRGHEVDRVVQQQRALHCARALNEAARAIKDETLRQQFLLAAGSYIDAQEKR